MRYSITVTLLAVLAAPVGASAQTSDSAIKNNPGYQSGASDSGKSGLDSSRGVPSSPLAGRPGTVVNGHPGSVSKHHKAHHHSE